MRLAIMSAALLVGGGLGAAQAAPSLPKTEAQPSVQKAACAWIDGVRICGGFGGPGYANSYRNYYGYGHRGYGYRNRLGQPEDYRTGSTRWWRSMDRERRGGFR